MRGFTTQRLLPGICQHINFRKVDVLRKKCRRRVAERQALAAIRNPIAIGYANTRCRTIPGEQHIAREISLCQIRQVPPIGIERAKILDPQFIQGVFEPDPPEHFPGKDIDAARSQKIPHRHFKSAGIGTRHNGHFVTGRQAQQLFGLINRQLQTRPPFHGAMRTAKQRLI